MPTILRLFGFIFFFYSREHEPPHIHIEGKGGNAKFIWDKNKGKFILDEVYKISNSDLKKITEVIEDNADLFILSWNKYFNDGKNN